MLVLTRRVYEDDFGVRSSRENEIVLVCPNGERVVVRLLSSTTRRGTIRVGIEAPRTVTILRGELEGSRDRSADDPDLAMSFG